MKNQGVDVDKLWLRMKDIIIKTMLSLQPDLLHNYKLALPSDQDHEASFQILTFDMIVDELGKPWLLKVNQAPDFENGLQLENVVKIRVLRDTFKVLALNEKAARRKVRRYTNYYTGPTRSPSKKSSPSGKQLTAGYKKRLSTHLKNLGNYEWIFPIDRNQMVQKMKHPTQSETVNKGTRYIQNESNKEKEKSETQTNFQLRGQTFQSSHLAMATMKSDKNLETSKQRHSSSNLM